MNTDAIIAHVGHTLGLQHDAAEFIDQLTLFFPHIQNEIRYTVKEMRKCNSCNSEYEHRIDREADRYANKYHLNIPTSAETSALLQQSKSNKTKTLTVADYLKHSYAMEKMIDFACPACGINNIAHPNVTHSITIENPGNVLILPFNIFIYNNTDHSVTRQPLRISGAPATTLAVCGSQYKLKAAIFHHGNNQFHGHYTAYVRVNNTWNLLNDTTVLLKQSWPKLAKNVYILFYEKNSSR